MTEFKKAEVKAEVLGSVANKITWRIDGDKDCIKSLSESDGNEETIEYYNYRITVLESLIDKMVKML